jgi:hypothetical protein
MMPQTHPQSHWLHVHDALSRSTSRPVFSRITSTTTSPKTSLPLNRESFRLRVSAERDLVASVSGDARLQESPLQGRPPNGTTEIMSSQKLTILDVALPVPSAPFRSADGFHIDRRPGEQSLALITDQVPWGFSHSITSPHAVKSSFFSQSTRLSLSGPSGP